MDLFRVVAVAVCGLCAPAAWAQNASPPLELSRAPDGELRVSLPADPSLLLEQTGSLMPPISWEPALVGTNGEVSAQGPARFFRWRRLSFTEALPEAGPLQIVEPPPRLRSGEWIQFDAMQTALGVAAQVTWRINGLMGGDANVGTISTNGFFQAPVLTTNRTVEIRAETIQSDGTLAQAATFVTIQAATPASGPKTISPTGGTVISTDQRARMEVPPGAVAANTIFSATALSAAELSTHDTDTQETLAVLELQPDGITFAQPVRVEFPLDRYVTPGTALPLSMESGGQWQASGIQAIVAEDGFTAVALLPHFSRWAILRPRLPGPILPAAPTVTSITPATLREGELRPLLLRGTGLGEVTRVTVHQGAGLTPTPLLEVQGFAFDASAPGEMGVLLKSFADPSLAAGVNRTYQLRLTVRVNVFTDVNVTVTGLNEFVVLPGQTVTIPAEPPTNRATYSRIEVPESGLLQSLARVLAWQATDEVRLAGVVDARGPNGVSAVGANPGRMLEPARTRTGSGDGRRAENFIPLDGTQPNGRPSLSVNMNDYLPGSLNRIYGQGGAVGYDASDPRATLPAVSEAMLAHYDSVVNEAIDDRDAFDFNLWRVLAEDITEEHPEGRKGHQGKPGGFVPSSPRAGFQVGARAIEAGGGGGGGGGSFRPSFIFANGSMEVGLGGGSGGGGGGAISMVAGNTVAVGLQAVVNTSGGNGGAGGQISPIIPVSLTPEELAAIGRGGGGGPGGAGTIHLLAGETLENPGSAFPLFHQAGLFGEGGFIMSVRTHRQATPRAWLAPVEDPLARSQAELAGPDFSSSGRAIRTGIRTARAVVAPALNPYDQEISVRVFNSRGVTTNHLRGVQANARSVRLLLAPGTNYLAITSLGDHAVLNREILVLNTPDFDGDGLSDTEEITLGLNPNSADSDGDGIPDSDEWLAGGQAVPGDSDGDGVPDNVEQNYGSNARDPDSTPWNVSTNRAVMVAAPGSVRVIRPAFGAAQGVPPGLSVASSREVRLIRPAVGSSFGVAPFVTTLPYNVRVVRPAFGSSAGLPPNITIATPQRIRVVRE